MNGATVDPAEERLEALAKALLIAWKKHRASHQCHGEAAEAASDRRQLATQPVVALADWRRASA